MAHKNWAILAVFGAIPFLKTHFNKMLGIYRRKNTTYRRKFHFIGETDEDIGEKLDYIGETQLIICNKFLELSYY
jgi:hypothetical protein